LTPHAGAGDHRRHEALIAESAPALWRLTAGYVTSPAERDDLFQEICLALWTALPRFRGDCSERTFVYRIAHNRAMTFTARARASPADLWEARHVEDARPRPDEELAATQSRERLLAAIRSLGVGLRQAITLHLEGLTHAEIAAVLGISENLVAVRLHRAGAELRQRLQREERT
jgi:RNA polymerase sigma-70 factor (ECF subfamily)